MAIPASIEYVKMENKRLDSIISFRDALELSRFDANVRSVSLIMSFPLPKYVW